MPRGEFRIGYKLLSLVILAFAVIASSIFAAASPTVHAATGINERINFQGRLFNAQGAVVPDGYYNIQFKIYQDGDGLTAGNTTGLPAGSLKWTESWLNNDSNGVLVRNGYMSVELGSVTPFGSNVDWNQSTLWLSMNIGNTNATCTPFSSCTPDGEMVPMKRMSATPYALNAGKLGGLTASGFIQNTSTLQTANIAVQSAGAGNIAALVQGASGQTADILQVKATGSASPLFSVSSSGNVTIQPVSDGAGIFAVKSASGSTTALSVNTSTGLVSVNGNVQAAGLISASLDTATAVTLNVGTATASAVTIGKANTTTTIQGNTAVTLNTTPGTTITCQNVSGYLSTCDSSVLTPSAANFIQNGTTVQPTSNFYISGTGRTDTKFLTPTIDTATAATLNIGTAGAPTTTGISLNQNTTVVAGKSLTITGSGTRPSTPSEGMLYYDTTTKQLVQYNGTKWVNNGSDAYLVAANNSSQADKDAADYVADGTGDEVDINNALTRANPSSVTSGARKSGKVYLFAGTYTIAGSISVPNNTTLAGAGMGTLITVANGFNATLSAITNTTNGGNGTGVVIQDLKLDGNKANQSGTINMYGIVLNGVGSASLPGAKINNVAANNWYGNSGFTSAGIYITGGSRNTLSNITALSNSSSGIMVDSSSYNVLNSIDSKSNTYGIYLYGSTNNTVSDSTLTSNSANGIYVHNNANSNAITGNIVVANTNTNIYVYGSSYNTISSNQVRASGSNDGIGLDSSALHNIVSGNNVQSNNTGGIFVGTSSTNNSITGNKIQDNGGNGTNKGIYLTNASSNTISDNSITDTAATTNNAILINSGSNNYLSNNSFTSNPGTSTIVDNGTGTVYASQARAENGAKLTNRTANDTEAFAIQNASGTNALVVDTTNNKLLIAGTVDTTTATTLNIGTTTATAVTIGSASTATTIQGNTGVTLNATTGTAMVCQNASGYLSTCDATYVAPTASSFIQNQAGTPGTAQTGNFNITGTGIAATLQAASVLGTTFDTASAIALEIGTTNATAINLNENVTVAAGKSLTVVGGNTGSRPASPTDGMVYYDTDTDQLIQWNGTKWMNNGSEAYLVAASNSSQADKDAADFVADGTADQTDINNALERANPTSATSGARKSGKVYLFAGTYTVNDAISIPNDTTLAGAGRGSIIKFANINGQTRNMIVNTDTTATSKGVTVRDIQLDGNWTGVNTSGTITGIYFTSLGGGSGTTARQGPTVLNMWVNNFLTNGIRLDSSPNGVVSGNNVQSNSGNGIYLSSSNRTSITGNVSQGNGGSGILLAGQISTAVSGNTIAVNGTAGIYFNGGSHDNTITANNFYANGGNANNNAIYITNSDFNTITNNSISETSATGTNYAINIIDSTSDKNYLADNVFNSTPGTSSINDSGTGTVYANQARGENGAKLTNRNANDTEAFSVQNAAGTNVLAVDTTNNKVLVAGTLDTSTATTLNVGTATATAITIGSGSITTTIQGNTGVTLNATTGTTMVCRNASGLLSSCDAAYLTPTGTNFIQNQNASAQTTANFWISGTGQAATLTAGTVNATTNLVTSTIDTASSVALAIGGTTAASVDIGKAAGTINLKANTTLVGTSGSTITVQGATQATSNTSGNLFVLKGATGNGSGAGGQLTLQGGSAGATSGANGGNVYISGGAGTGTGVGGLVVITTPTFSTAVTDANCFTGGAPVAASCTITNASVDGSSAVLAGFTVDGQTATLPNPTITTAGRVVYVTASSTTSDFTLSVNGGGQGNLIAMRKNTTATMIWNGSAWTAAGASSSTTLQAAYDNTLQSAGGAELVVSKTTATNGFTIRDSSTNSVNGALLTVQSSSAANLFSVNSNVTEYTSNSGAETFSTTTSTFPASTWVALNSSTVSRNTNTSNIATGQGSAQIATSTTAGSGVKNVLNTTLTPGQHYNVSFSTKLSSGTFTDMAIYYSINGSTDSVTCTTDLAIKTSVWTKVNCTFTAPSSGLTSSNSINIRQVNSGVAHTFYVDNISVTIAADYNYATDAGADDIVNFSTNWTTAGTATVTQNLSDGNDASSSAQASTSTANSGVRNKLAINPLTSTLYRVSVYVKLSSGAALNDFRIRYTPNGGTSYVDCVDYNKRVVTSTWTQITCYITTDATATSNPYVYFLQTTASGTRVLLVDTFSMTLASNTTPNVQIGSGSNGGPTTLFTLDKGASAPIAANNDALLGSMYYDTTLGKLQCYEADGWGACGSSPDNIVTISPEYTNAVMHGTGVGTMVSDICSDPLDINNGSSGQPTICGTNETYNFYKWTSPQATAQTYSIYVTYQLPATFKEFASGQTSVMGRTDSTNATVQYQIYRSNTTSGMTTCGAAVTVSTGIQTSWQPGLASGASDPSTCGFAAGDSVVFRISTTSSSNGNAYVGNLGFTFSNR